MTAKDHNRLLGIFYFVMGGLQVFAALAIAISYGLVGSMMLSTGTRPEDQSVGGIFVLLAVVVGLVIAAIAAFTLLTGFKVFKERPIGRTLGITISILCLFSFPLGTALGIYGLWFFFGEMGKNFYAGLSHGSPYPPGPPSPSSWQ